MTTVTEWFDKLVVSSEDAPHRAALATGLESLKSNPNDADALKTCLVALINLERYETAADWVKNKFPGAVRSDNYHTLTERAYIYYKTEDKESLIRARHEADGREPLLHVLAQHFYRIGNYEEALAIYRDLIKEKSNLLDSCVNERAVIAESGSGIAPTALEATDSYDLAFNEASIAISRSRFEKAAGLLALAKSKCETAMEGADPQEAFNELAPILIQQAYVAQREGKFEEANEILAGLDVGRLGDEGLKLIVINNKLSIKGYTNALEGVNPNLLYRQLGFPNSISNASQKLTLAQKAALQRNELVIGSHAGKSTSSKPHTKSYPSSASPASLEAVAKAGVVLGITEPHTAAKVLYKQSLSSIGETPLVLAAVQANVSVENFDNAATILEKAVESDISVLLKPYIALPLLAVYDTLKRLVSKRALLQKIYDQLEMTEIVDDEDAKYIRHIAFSLISVDEEKSKHLFRKLDSHGKDALVSAVLGNGEPSDLIELDELTEGVDVEDLVKNGILPLISNKRTASAIITSKPHSKRHRKNPKHPAKIEGAKGPDPERWLPVKDRSYYKSKKGKKNARDTQGGAADNTTEESVGASSIPAAAPAKTASAAKTKKKKVKGRR
ncbi:unnamed protein product [Kuraishia capsulata CBS 1993]|uniref:Signal recognition particle subunit SRP72 n=1 Tax=Kuraishia capsulata CBS 1993 TaxID=1382522 RepID=W6MQW9_9ASCO|nr:uncharacterized protein KUCA_T00003631001 [Kuraishia capsulata CBS 1993]CDK27652.1 unnamed protein product [Kuraishia capsulata CBS 1993]